MPDPDPFLTSALQALALALNTAFFQTRRGDDAVDPLVRASSALIDLGNRLGVQLPQDALDGRVSLAQAWGELRGWIWAGLAPQMAEAGHHLGDPASRLRLAMTELVAIETETEQRRAA
jgi:hypothetical protein